MKDILKYSIWLGLYAVLIIPFIVANNMFFPYITGKAFTFRIIIEIIFGLWLILIIKDKEFRPKNSLILWAVAIFTFILLIANINAEAPFKAFWSNYERMEGWLTFAHLFIYFLVLSSMFNSEKLWLWFLRVNLIMGTIMAITSIADGAKENIVRIAGPLGNPIYISVYFLFIFFFALILLYKDVLTKNLENWIIFKKIFANILFYVYLFVAGLSFFVVYRTSRGALLGLLGGVLITMILIAFLEKKRKVIRHIAFGGISILIVLVVVFLNFRQSSFVQNNPTLKRFAEISWENVNGQARQLVWPMAIKGFKERPILGWGQEGFNYVFNKYYDPGMYGQETWFDRAHNAPLDFLVAGGILGFLSYLALFGSALYLLWLKKNSFSITEKSLLTGVLVGYLFQAIFVFDNLISYIMFFTVLAYIHSHIVEKETHKPAFAFFSAFVSNKEYQDYIFIPAIVILIGIGIWWLNINQIFINQSLIQSLRLVQSGRVIEGMESFKKILSYSSIGEAEIREQLVSLTPNIIQSEKIDNDTKQKFFSFTIAELDKQIAKVPNDARYYILTGSLINNFGNPEQALSYINKAVELSPQKQAMRFELIKALYALGRTEEALAESKANYELEPNYEQARVLYETLAGKTQ